MTLRNHAAANAARLALAENIAFWRAKRDGTTDQLRIQSYQRIIDGLVKVAEEKETAHAGN